MTIEEYACDATVFGMRLKYIAHELRLVEQYLSGPHDPERVQAWLRSLAEYATSPSPPVLKAARGSPADT